MSAASTKAETDLNLRKKVISLHLKAGDYIAGQICSDVPLSHARLLNPEQSVIRRLQGISGQPELQLQFLAESEGEYSLQCYSEEESGDIHPDLTIWPSAPYEKSEIPDQVQASPRIQAILESGNRKAAAQKLLEQIADSGTPLKESGPEPGKIWLTFLWQGKAGMVRVIGGPGSDHDPLYNIPETDLWFRSYTVPEDTRLSYQLAPDIPDFDGSAADRRMAILATAQQDPLNPRSWTPFRTADRFSRYSITESEDPYRYQWLQCPRKDPSYIEEKRFRSQLLQNTRSIRFYHSRHTDFTGSPSSRPLLIFFDGSEYLNQIPVPAILTNLINAGQIPDVNALFVDNPGRMARATELPCNPVFADMLKTELLPLAIREFGYPGTPEQIVLAGSSYGGLAATYAASVYPDTFNRVLSQSGSFWWNPVFPEQDNWLAGQIAEGRLSRPGKMYFNAGLFETGRDSMTGILESNRRLKDVLEHQNTSFRYQELPSGHDYYQWRLYLADGLVYLLNDNKA